MSKRRFAQRTETKPIDAPDLRSRSAGSRTRRRIDNGNGRRPAQIRNLWAALGLTSLMMVMLVQATQPAGAECRRWQKASNEAEQAVIANQQERAESLWEKAVKAARHCAKGEPALAISYKRLGECYQKNGKLEDALESFQMSEKAYKDLGSEDSELKNDQEDLASVYRRIDPEDLGETAAQIIRSAGINYVTIQKLQKGQRIQISFADKMTKEIKGGDVDRIGLDKLVSFDLMRDEDNNLKLANIKGLRVKTKFWVKLTDSLIRTGDTGAAPTADFTARKLGISKTVTCRIPGSALHHARSAVMLLKNFRDSFFKTPDKTTTATEKSSPGASDKSVTAAGAAATPGIGAAATPGIGADTTPGIGADTTPGIGADTTPGIGAAAAAGAQTGATVDSQTGTATIPRTGAAAIPGIGAALGTADASARQRGAGAGTGAAIGATTHVEGAIKSAVHPNQASQASAAPRSVAEASKGSSGASPAHPNGTDQSRASSQAGKGDQEPGAPQVMIGGREIIPPGATTDGAK